MTEASVSEGRRTWKGLRWLILAVIFAAGALNYIDRNVLSFTMIDMGFKRDLLGLDPSSAFSETDDALFKQSMGIVDAAFKLGYALGFLITAWAIMRFGLKFAYAAFITVWSLAGMAAAGANGFAGLAAARVVLAMAEAGHFPAAARTIAEWFPTNQRATAFGLFNASGNVGVVVAAWLIPVLTLAYGWRASFLVAGAIGLVVCIAWLAIYRPLKEHPRLSARELSLIEADLPSGGDEAPRTWSDLLRDRRAWSFVGAKVIIDPVFWFYLTWLPDFFNSNEALETKLTLATIGIPFLIIFIVGDLGAIFFGWLSSKLLILGLSLNSARKSVMALCAICMLPLLSVAYVEGVWVAIALLTLATGAHQGFSAILFCSVTDLYPKSDVPRVIAMGGIGGALAGAAFAASIGFVRVEFGYAPIFSTAAIAYVVALGIFHLAVPRYR
ncbi:MFS transporter [Erythrobacter sp. NFXS35]|uniref:MFS transporter n=1 Tax=Erythrobacter sp. NFXS35 TaxID=2818436 RepID=UPI0032DE873D